MKADYIIPDMDHTGYVKAFKGKPRTKEELDSIIGIAGHDNGDSIDVHCMVNGKLTDVHIRAKKWNNPL